MVPASVERNPQLNIPLERRGDINLASNDISTPAQGITDKCHLQMTIQEFTSLFDKHVECFQIPSRTFVAMKIMKDAMIYCVSVYGNNGEYDNIPRTPIAVKNIVQRRICLKI
jgi:hypothetical protein